MTTTDERTEALTKFENMALPYTDDLFRAAVSLLGDRSQAEQVVQDSLMEAWKSFRRCSFADRRTWLFKILIRMVSKQRPKRPAPMGGGRADELLSAILDMPQQDAVVLMLCDVQAFTYREIQETLEIPIDAVISRLASGREYLRGQFSAMANAASGR